MLVSESKQQIEDLETDENVIWRAQALFDDNSLPSDYRVVIATPAKSMYG